MIVNVFVFALEPEKNPHFAWFSESTVSFTWKDAVLNASERCSLGHARRTASESRSVSAIKCALSSSSFLLQRVAQSCNRFMQRTSLRYMNKNIVMNSISSVLRCLEEGQRMARGFAASFPAGDRLKVLPCSNSVSFKLYPSIHQTLIMIF